MKPVSIDKTPYTAEINAAIAFYDEAIDSDVAKKGVKDYASGTAKDIVLRQMYHDAKIVEKVSTDEYEREALIVKNLELVRARAQDLEQSSKQFVDGEQAYQRLAQAKELDKLVNVNHMALPESRLQLNPAMHSAYLREIIETGGAPSILELAQKAEALGARGCQEESMAKSAINKLTSVLNDKINAEHKVNTKLEIEPKREAISLTRSALNKSDLAQAYSSLEKLSSLILGDDKAATKEQALEQEVNELKFLIETHIFAGSFNSKLID